MCFYATEVASPKNKIDYGASTLVVDKHTDTVLYATAPKGIHSDKVASPGCL